MHAPIARDSDPVSSHEAADHMNESGARRFQALAVLDAVLLNPGLTSRELAEKIDGLDRYAVARRLSDLEHIGLVMKGKPRRCAIGGRSAVEWLPYRQDGDGQLSLA